ncbi:heme A synthase [Photobacterium sanctipauli]|uniref:Heme A synthase n=1 Tax=Photobacterium sanctipauli TaxID=1342794 RepID=A0A2T3NSP9_9GAMM|nr:COX15/CtaA family protein [Photobacterium sanctipauli]PSW19316.1 heme A synthase [Photobacterium sanctipauli]
MKKLFGFRALVALTFLLSLCVIALGAYTRLTEAGLGCPDWPGCYGFVSVPQTAEQLDKAAALFPDAPVEADKAWNEMLHRYIAGTLGLLILLINILAWRKAGRPRLLPGLLLVTVIFQALLGMWTVTMVLMPVVVMGHLLGGFATASLLLLLLLLVLRLRRQTSSFSGSGPRPSKGLQLFAAAAMAAVVGQIALGGWTAANYAALVCTQLPVCEVDWAGNFDPSAFNLIQPVHDTYQYGVLNFQQRVSIHAVHRIGAMVVTGVLLLLAWRLWRLPAMRSAAVMTVAMLALQVSLGITNVVASLPLHVAVGHNVVGVLLLLVMVAVNYRIYCLRAAEHSWLGAVTR